MELGARVCTPKGPDCRACPLREHCLAYKRVATGGLGSHATEGKESGSTQWTCIEGGAGWTLLSNHVARGVNCSETFRPQGSLSVTKLVGYYLWVV